MQGGLLDKIDAALAVLVDSSPTNDGAALNILGALINQIEVRRGKGLTEAEADRLRDAALRVIDLLSD